MDIVRKPSALKTRNRILVIVGLLCVMGIGLALSRQMAFNHGGNLSLSNNQSGKGAKATLMLPIATP
jgi:signal transduction histidine kinase